MDTLSWAEAEKIIEVEVRRFVGTLPGYDRDDLRQECRIVVARALERVQRRHGTGAAYVRTTCKHRLSNLLRDSMTAGRCPHDAWGRPRPGLVVSDGDEIRAVSSATSIEKEVADRQAVRYLQATLDPRDWRQLVDAFADGALAARAGDDVEAIRLRAIAILGRVDYRVRRESEVEMSAIPQTPVEELPSCHALGAKPQGYDRGDPECHQCPDKFTCLPEAIKGKLVSVGLSADREVEAVVEGRIEFMSAVARMKRRLARMKANEEILPEERADWEGLAPGGASTNAPEDEEEVEDAEDEAAEVEEAAEDVAEGEPEEAVAAEPEASPSAPEEGVVMKDKKAPKKPEKAAPKAKPAKPEKAPKAAKAPKPEPTKPAEMTLRAVAKDASHVELFVGEKLVARVEKAAEGWGWFAANGKLESMDWFERYDQAVKDLVLVLEPEVEAKGAKLVLDESAKKLPKPASAKPEKPTKPEKAEKPAKAAKKAKPEKGEGEGRQPVPDYWPRMRDERPYPSPRALSEEEMVEKLAEAQAKLGANIELDYGMQIVRRTRAGDVIAVIRPNGFEYTIPDAKLVKQARLDSPTQLFGSLSSVAMWGEGRLRTGNDFFNLSKHNCTEVRSADNRIIDRRGGVPG